MKNWFGKKQIVLGALVLALGAAVYLNYSLVGDGVSVQTGNQTQTTTTTSGDHLGDSQFVGNTTGDYFVIARQSRNKAREEALDILEDVLADKSTDKETLAVSVAQVTAIAQAVAQEDKIENLVKAKGFSECIAYIEGENCSVVVKSEQLSDEQTVQILEIVTSQSAVLAKNVSISAVKS